MRRLKAFAAGAFGRTCAFSGALAFNSLGAFGGNLASSAGFGGGGLEVDDCLVNVRYAADAVRIHDNNEMLSVTSITRPIFYKKTFLGAMWLRMAHLRGANARFSRSLAATIMMLLASSTHRHAFLHIASTGRT
jgi:hypothetical protein